MKRINVAIIGCGRMGTERFNNCLNLGAYIIYVYDTDLLRAKALSDKSRNTIPLQYINEIDWKKIDAVFICTPPFARSEVEKLAIINDVAIFLEKPIGLSAISTQETLQLLKQHKVINAVGYMNRYRDSIEKAKQFIANEKILGVIGHWVCGNYKVDWWSQKDLSGGPINEQSTHLIDLLRFLIGDITDVKSIEENNELGTSVAALLKFENGQIGNIFYSCQSKEKQIGINIYLENGVLSLNGWDFSLQYKDYSSEQYENKNKIFEIETDCFLQAVTSKKQQLIKSDFFDAYKTQCSVDLIKDSLKLGGETCLVN